MFFVTDMANRLIHPAASLSDAGFKAWHQMLRRADPQTGQFTIGLRSFAMACGIHRQQLRSTISRLFLAGDIFLSTQSKRSTQITIRAIKLYNGTQPSANPDMPLYQNKLQRNPTQCIEDSSRSSLRELKRNTVADDEPTVEFDV